MLCDDLDGWNWGESVRKAQERGYMCVYLVYIYVCIWYIYIIYIYKIHLIDKLI